MKMRISFLLCALVSLVTAQAANIAFMSFHPGDDMPHNNVTNSFTRAPDVGYTELLLNAGHTVTRFVSVDNFNVSQLATFDLVIISRSVASGHYQQDNETAAWNGLAVPTILLNGYIIRGGSSGGNNRLGYMVGNTIPDTAGPMRLRALAPGHPIFAGISMDANSVMLNTYAVSGTNGTILAPNGIAQRGVSVVSGATFGGGVVLANATGDPNTSGMMIGEWLAGSSMNTTNTSGPSDILGGHRLVLLTGSREFGMGNPVESAGIYDLAADGAQLLLNAVNYMTSSRISIRTVNTIDNEFPGVNDTSLLEALSDLQDGDYVRFNIPGPGPHVIVTPIGGYPLITNHYVVIDGFTQSNSVPNSNAILGGNNAQQRIVLDSTGTETLPNPDPMLTNRPLRRSTRLDFPTFVGNTGYGASENCILGVFEADNVTIRGLSFIARYTPNDENDDSIAENDPSIYCVALVKQATNAHVNGCLFGMAPGGTTMANLRPAASSLAAFRWRIDGDVYSDGATFGTDGDGFNDRAEFNVSLGSRIALALELPGARVSGNYVNVFPNGNTFADIDALYAAQLAVADEGTLEFFENGRFAHNTVVGTDGNGVSDSDERNIVSHTVYDVNLEFYSAATNVVIAGNYFGVGVNGTTAGPVSTNINNNFLSLPGGASARIGSNGDGVSDALEGNLIVNTLGRQFVPPNLPVVTRGNTFRNNTYESLVSDQNLIAPAVNAITNNVLSGTVTGDRPVAIDTAAFLDLYTVDAAALAKTNYWPAPITHPSRWLGAFVDNGTGDLDPAVGAFAFDLSGFVPPLTDTTYVIVNETYSTELAASNAGRAVTGPFSAPVSRRPELKIQWGLNASSEPVFLLSWLAPDNAFWVQQQNNGLDPTAWLEFDVHTHTAGRNITEVSYDNSPSLQYYYRLISRP